MTEKELELIRKDPDFRDMTTTFKAQGKEDGSYTITASTPDVDRDDEIIEPSAFAKSLPAYLKTNPVILWMHDMFSPPIARAVDGRITDGSMELDIVFASTPFAQEIKTLVDEGMLSTVSVGGSVGKSEADKSGRRVITEMELWETSIVTIPSNRSAQIQRAIDMGLSVPKNRDGESKRDSKPEKVEKTTAERLRIARS